MDYDPFQIHAVNIMCCRFCGLRLLRRYKFEGEGRGSMKCLECNIIYPMPTPQEALDIIPGTQEEKLLIVSRGRKGNV